MNEFEIHEELCLLFADGELAMGQLRIFGLQTIDKTKAQELYAKINKSN